MISATKLQTMGQQNNSSLSIAHLASTTPFYYVEEVIFSGDAVLVEFFDENDENSKIETVGIAKKDLIEFVDEFYGPAVINEMMWGEHVQCEFTPTAADYLAENLRKVTTDFINAGRHNGYAS